jgi:ribosome maturation factor RimP
MDVAEKIRQIAESSLTEGSHFIVNVLLFAKQRPPKVMVIVDGDQGVNIDDCASLSRQIAAALDEQNVIQGAYTLEVTTPGVDQPLKLKRQFLKNVGRTFRLHLTEGRMVEGKVTAATEDHLVVEQDWKDGKPVPASTPGKKEKKLTEINFNQIEKAFVTVSFK